MMQFIRKLLSRFLPHKIKRMFCLATLGYIFSQVQSLEEERMLIRRLNLQLDLAEDEKAIKYAIMYANLIWKHIHTKEDGNVVHYYLRDLYSQLPEWMKYDSEDIMSSEIKQVAEVSTTDNLKVAINW